MVDAAVRLFERGSDCEELGSRIQERRREHLEGAFDRVDVAALEQIEIGVCEQGFDRSIRARFDILLQRGADQPNGFQHAPGAGLRVA